MNEYKVQVSIVVPVYNVEAYLDRCVQSLLSQDLLSDIEILLVDDGSTDRSGAICDDYAERHPQISVFHKENGGLSDARNYGLKRARGEYILFVDSDDFIEADACSSLLGDARKFSAEIVIGRVESVRRSKAMERYERVASEKFECHKVYTGKEYLEGCLEGGALRVEIGRHLYLREFLKENNFHFKKGILHEDEEFTPRVLLKASRVVLTDHVFYHYDNTRSGSIMNSHSMSMQKIQDRIQTYEKQRKSYRDVQPRRLRRLLEDDLSWKYMDCYCDCAPEKRRDLKINRITVFQCAYHAKRRLKALVFLVSPELYAKMKR